MGKYNLELMPDPNARNPLDIFDDESKERLSNLLGLTIYQVYLSIIQQEMRFPGERRIIY